MVGVKGTSGKVVEIDIQGIEEVMRMVRASGKDIKNGADMGVVRAGTFIQEEVKESVIGNRAEHRSVETGTFANSIEFKKVKDAEGIVKPRRVSYPNGQNTEEVANILEYSGRISGGPRAHFRNTEARNKGKVKEIIDNEVKKALQTNIKDFLKYSTKFFR